MSYRTLTYEQVAEFLQVSVRTIKRRVAARQMPAPRPFKPWRFDEQEFFSWWEQLGEQREMTSKRRK